MRRDEVLNGGSRTAGATGLAGMAELVEEIRPALHHHAPLRKIEGFVVRRFDFVLGCMSELHLDMSSLVPHLIQDCRCQAAKAMTRHLSFVAHPLKGT